MTTGDCDCNEGEECLFCESPWMSVKNKLPEFDIPVLVYHCEPSYSCDSQIEVAKIDSHKKWCPTHFCEAAYIEDVTHWMPLPTPPEDEN